MAYIMKEKKDTFCFRLEPTLRSATEAALDECKVGGMGVELSETIRAAMLAFTRVPVIVRLSWIRDLRTMEIDDRMGQGGEMSADDDAIDRWIQILEGQVPNEPKPRGRKSGKAG